MVKIEINANPKATIIQNKDILLNLLGYWVYRYGERIIQL